MQNLISLTTIIILTISCGGNASDNKNEIEKAVSEFSEKKGAVSSACDLISEEEIRVILSIPTEVKSTLKDVVRTYPTCFYEWKSLSYLEEKSIGGNNFKVNYPTELTLVLVQNASSKMFATSTQVYRDGVEIEGIGDAAIWGDQLAQLTFLVKNSMIHVHLKASADNKDNKEKAISIASKIIENL